MELFDSKQEIIQLYLYLCFLGESTTIQNFKPMSMMWINFLCLNKMNLLKHLKNYVIQQNYIYYYLFLVFNLSDPFVNKEFLNSRFRYAGCCYVSLDFILNKVCTFKYGVKVSWV